MVVVEDGAIKDQYALVTQYAPELSKRQFRGALVERIRPGAGLAPQGGPGAIGIPRQPQSQAVQTPQPGTQDNTTTDEAGSQSMSLLPGATSPFRSTEGRISVPNWNSTRSLPEQLHALDREIKSIVDNQEKADRLYNALPESKGGKVINTDIARGLLPAYAESREGRIKYTPATAMAAKVYAADRIYREIENRGDRKKLMFTAGGVAAGKSTVVDDNMVAQHDLVFDGTMRDTPQAIKTIQQALDRGWDIHINYIQRPIDLVIHGAMVRANNYGRWGTIGDLPAIHADAQRSIVEIAKHFEGEPRVKIRFWLNDGKTKSDKPKPISRTQLETGPLSYGEQNFRQRGSKAVVESFREAVASGKYSPELLRNFAGTDPTLLKILSGEKE